ncbi:MAG: hypothetical protein ACWGN1_01805 [Desulfobulbales bacterium]
MKKIKEWQLIYAACCLVYFGWMLHVGTNEFNRINQQYHALVAQLDAGKITIHAREELTADCYRNRDGRPGYKADDCRNMPPGVVAAKAREVKARLVRAKEKGLIKVVLFYAGFVIFFLFAPPFLLYLLIVAIIKVFLNVKIVR